MTQATSWRFFKTHWHPFVGAFLQCFNWGGVPALLTLANQTQSNDNEFQVYSPNADYVWPPYPIENVDFSLEGAYSIYNWELFFHIPLLIATQLSANQQFADALTWLQYIFNPTAQSSDSSPQRYWNVLPFATDTEPGRIQDLLQVMHVPTLEQTPQQQAELRALLKQIATSKADPFNPFAIARLRPIAFMKKAVMAYLDNLMAWGDYLFAQDTRESIYEATQLYVLADQILGPRPQTIPTPEVTQDLTFNDIQANLDSTSNYWSQMESIFPFGSNISAQSSPNPSQTSGVPAPGNFYFCIPSNTQLLGYWDTVADRLYKIRHCQNFAGQPQQLPLFAPPINPALLVQATALGVDVDSVLANMNAPAPNYRFTVMLQKAFDLCGEVRSLGASLLAALEKSDGEALALLRASQEASVLQAILSLKQTQVNEANANVASLQAAQALASYRQSYYQGLITAGLSQYETGQLALLTESQALKMAAQVGQLAAAGLSEIPDFTTGASGWAASAVAVVKEGGSNISRGASLGAQAIDLVAEALSYAATMLTLAGQWDRRSNEWAFQAQSAGLELNQIAQQLAAANFRVQIATADYQNQQLQVTNAQAIQNFLTSKYTNQQLYTWMNDQISGVYLQCYQIAFALAQRAELCFRFELGLTTSNYVQYGHWDSLHKGLLAGDGLYADLKTMETAYLDQNVREYEITKAISLAILDPVSLIMLKETGACVISLPEELFDIDYPGHYKRRIKSLSLTIPCVAGPYTSINCTLTLITNRIRSDPALASEQSYPENPQNSDPRFIYDLSATESIATSSAQNDAGLFEVNFRDERYLPFEGRGAISSWQLELPLGCNAFDFETITDIILNLKYTSRNGGSTLRDAAWKAAKLPPGASLAAPAPISAPSGPNSFRGQQALARLFSLKHEFPTEWHKLFSPAPNPPQSTTLNLSMERFPFQYRGMKLKISFFDVVFRFKNSYPPGFGLKSAPLSDFLSSGGQINVAFSPPSPAGTPTGNASFVPLGSSSSTLSGAPFGAWPGTNGAASGGAGAWVFQLNATGTPLVDSNGNLVPSVVSDIYVICHFSGG